MNNIFKSAIIAILVWQGSAKAAEDPPFISEIKNVGAKYQSLASSPESIQLMKDGRKSDVNTQLKTLVPDKNKTASDYFILSNMLYRADISASDSYIKMADERSPDNPYILFERAMHEHRAGNCKTALPIYEKSSILFKETQNPIKLWVYMTHCRLVLGDYLGAIESWRKVDFQNRHTAIEKSMYEIFSSNDPDSKREQLIASISTGSSDDACELIDLDKKWETDWWNVRENQEYLDHDIAFLRNLAKKNNKIDLAIGFCVDALALDDAEFRSYITKSGYWEGMYLLPEGPTETYKLVSQLVERNIATPAEILEHYEGQLVKRYVATPKNKRTLDVLAYLYSATGHSDKLKEIDTHGWKSLKIQKYAESYIHGIPQTSAEFQPVVEAAAVDFPNSVMIQGANATLHHQSKAKLVFLTKYVAAQFSDVKNNWRGPHRLGDFMASLEYEVSVTNNSLKETGSKAPMH